MSPTRTRPLRPQNNIITPVSAVKLDSYLHGYMTHLRHYLVSGFTFGFRLNSFQTPNNHVCTNLQSALKHPQVTQSKIDKEVQLGRISGPFLSPPYTKYTISPLGLREKKTPGEFRLIHNLSYPYDDTSVNAGVPREYATVSYASVGDATKHIVDMGQHCFLAKTDVKSAFRIIPVHPSDRHLLGFKWQDHFFFLTIAFLWGVPHPARSSNVSVRPSSGLSPDD